MTDNYIKNEIKKLGEKGSVFGLEQTAALAAAAGNPQNSLKFIHIAGTNGKGSVLAFVSTVLSLSGFKTGRYISPSVTSYFEKYQVNGEEITEAEYFSLAEYLLNLCREKSLSPTLFEFETVLGFLWFKRKGCDIVVLETGLGGELDATNIVKTTVLSVITTIGLDHKNILGDSLEEIAAAKAGIIKEGVPVCTGERGSVLKVIEKAAGEKNAPMYTAYSSEAVIKEMSLKGTVFDFESHRGVRISLLGGYQVKNAVLALKALDILKDSGWDIKEPDKNISAAKWPGRTEVISENPLFICDGCHNPQGARALKKSMEELFGKRKFIIILGILKDKDYSEILDEILPMAKKVFAVTPENNRALSGRTLSEIINKKGVSCETAEITEAAELAEEEAGKEDIILACGSLSYLGDIISYGKSKQNTYKR
ncbi:MAG: bifunctional folylpolyglutamate synthase/dihydrofolate synthase [Clostridiales bacterium]|nr:bifunctional folylpolyglutamate synthase/dihydrofolate synthase [Clostridiales bacterium]